MRVPLTVSWHNEEKGVSYIHKDHVPLFQGNTPITSLTATSVSPPPPVKLLSPSYYHWAPTFQCMNFRGTHSKHIQIITDWEREIERKWAWEWRGSYMSLVTQVGSTSRGLHWGRSYSGEKCECCVKQRPAIHLKPSALHALCWHLQAPPIQMVGWIEKK